MVIPKGTITKTINAYRWAIYHHAYNCPGPKCTEAIEQMEQAERRLRSLFDRQQVDMKDQP